MKNRQSNFFLACKLLLIMFNYKTLFLITCLMSIYSIFKFYQFIKMPFQKNIYDLLLFTFSDFYFVFYVLSLLFLLTLYKYLPTSKFNEYLIIKFENRKVWLFSNLVSILFIGAAFILILIFICLLESFGKVDYLNKWSEFSRNNYKYSLGNIFNSSSPVIIALNNIGMVYLYLCILGFTFFISHLVFRNSILSFVIAFGTNLFSVIIFIAKIQVLYQFTYIYYVLILMKQYQINVIKEFTLPSLMYWFSLILIVLLISMFRLNKVDFYWRGK